MDPVETGIAITHIPWIPVPEEVTVPDIVSPDAIEALIPETGVVPTVIAVAEACDVVPGEVVLYHWVW